SRLEVRHRQLRHERAVWLDQPDDQTVALRDNSSYVTAVAPNDLGRADDVGSAWIDDESRPWRGEIVVCDTIDRVREAVGSYGRAVVETKPPADLEGVDPAVPRDRK